jgi:putative FmdB family regulatory protein
MPLYDYVCSECGHQDIEVHSMFKPDLTVCPACEESTYKKQVSLPHTTHKEFRKPIEMFSIAMEDMADVRAFKQQCPDVDCSDDPADPMFGVPIAKSRHAKTQALKAAGFMETK